MSARNSEAGEWRAIPERQLWDPAFMALSPDGRLLWFVLRLQLGPIGMKAMMGAMSVLEDGTGLPRKRLEAARRELEAGHFLAVDGPVWWLRGALDDNPTLVANNPKHRTYVLRLFAPLASTMLGARYREEYPEWFSGPSDTVSDTVSGGYANTSTSTPTTPSTPPLTRTSPKTPPLTLTGSAPFGAAPAAPEQQAKDAALEVIASTFNLSPAMKRAMEFQIAGTQSVKRAGWGRVLEQFKMWRAAVDPGECAPDRFIWYLDTISPRKVQRG